MGREWSWSRSLRRGEREKEAAPPAGCMSGVFQLFDLHQILFRTTATSHGGADGDPGLHRDRRAASPPGVVAPRNSLELEDEAAAAASASAISSAGEEYGIPVPESKTPTSSEGRGGSQGTKAAAKAGNVVARLMGLDQMPDDGAQDTPRTSAGYYGRRELESPPPVIRSHQQRKVMDRRGGGGGSARDVTAVTPPPRRPPLQPRSCNVLAAAEDGRNGTRSLPDTPRMSSARRSWEADPRLSLQQLTCYKENAPPTAAAKDLRCSPCVDSAASPSPPLLAGKPRRRSFGQQLDGNRSPGSYADEIIKLVKETVVARRIARRKSDVEPLVDKQKSCSDSSIDKRCITPAPEETKPGRSPRLRNIPGSPKNKPAVNEAIRGQGNSSPRLLTPPTPPPLPARPSDPFLSTPHGEREVLVKSAIRPPRASPGKNTKTNSERFMERLRKPPPAAATRPEESFVSPAPLSPQPRRRCSLPAFVPGIRKQQPSTSPAPPALRQISDQLLLHCGEGDRRDQGGSSSTGAGPEQFRYVRSILERTGVHSHTPPPFAAARWYSPSHPVDPILLHQLERSFTGSSGPLRHRCNRKLLFHLVDELLADLLWPVLRADTWPRRAAAAAAPRIPDGEALVQHLWSQITSYPAVQDVGALVEADLPAANVRRLLLHPAVADEAGTVASQLAADILESLVGDAAAALLTPPWGPGASVPTEAERRLTTA